MNDETVTLPVALPLFVAPDDRIPIGDSLLSVEVPLTAAEGGSQLLEYHRLVLEAAGITDLSELGSMQINGPIAPQKGITVPSNDLFEDRPIAFHWAYRVAADGANLERIGGQANVLKARPMPTISMPWPGGPDGPFPRGFARRDAMSVSGTFDSLRASRETPVGAYLAAGRLVLRAGTTIVLAAPIKYLIIIARQIVVESAVTITWERPVQPTSYWFEAAQHGVDMGVAEGLEGALGAAGADGVPGNAGIQGGYGPAIQLWTLDMNRLPVIDVRGQDGQDGQVGQPGGHGGRGETGRPERRGVFGICQSGPGSGGDGGPGGRGGNGGPGGRGGDGGRFTLYTTRATLEGIGQPGLAVRFDGGRGGRGGDGGEGGRGGGGGERGSGTCPPGGGRIVHDGDTGPPGPYGNRGPDGPNGDFYSDAVKFEIITQEEFDKKLSAPALMRLEPSEPGGNPGYAQAGEAVRVFGERISPSDILTIDGEDIPCTHIDEHQFTFVVPLMARGGPRTLQLRQSDDTTLSNELTLAIYPVLTAVEPVGRLRPGSTVTLRGSGFSESAVVRVNGQDMPGMRFRAPDRVEFTMLRPAVLESNPEGEAVTIQVILPEALTSKELKATLDTVRMVVLGDSVLWGQGLPETYKIHSLVKQAIQRREGNIGVYDSMLAHSGAIIGRGNTGSGPALNGEIPTDFPTVLQQLDSAIPAPGTVDLVLIDGGINDINVRRILNPHVPESELLELIERHCYDDMHFLLGQVLNRLPKAKVIVTGYVPIVSEESDTAALTVMLTFLGLKLALIPGALAGALVGELFRADVAARAALFAKEGEKALQRAIDAVNVTRAAEPGQRQRRVFLAQPEFGREHAALASDPWIFGIGQTGTPQDAVAGPRGEVCRAAGLSPTDTFICERASMGHPNAAGARAYADEIIALLSEQSFPAGFLWGVATAGHQVEGNITNNDWHIFTTSPGIQQRIDTISWLAAMNTRLVAAGEAIRHSDITVLVEDLERACLLGLNAYRFSIEWSRVEPVPGQIDETALQYYDTVLNELRRRGLKPLVTLNHLTLPAWVLTPSRTLASTEDQPFRNSLRGWESVETLDAFINFVSLVVRRYCDKVDTWITLNEPAGSMVVVGYIAGFWPPGFVGDGARARKVYFNLLRAHARAYQTIKALYPDASRVRIGIAHNMTYLRLTWDGGGIGNVNAAARNQMDYFYNYHLLDSFTQPHVDEAIARRASGRRNTPRAEFYGLADPNAPLLDFIGVNYYRSSYAFYDQLVATTAGFTGGRFLNDLSREGADHRNLLNSLGWEIYPKGLYHILKELHARYDLPILITENGMPQSTDMLRAPYTVAHLDHILRAIGEGVRVEGYIHWTIADNFEWHENYRPESRFGLFTVDRRATDAIGRPTLDRRITEGALALQAVIAENSVREATETFGIITQRAYSVSPPLRSSGGVWEGTINDRVGMSLYISCVANGSFLGMVFFQDTHQWHRLEDLAWDTRHLTFAFHLRNGTLVRSAATATSDGFNGTFDGRFGAHTSWQVRRQWLCGAWQSTSTEMFPTTLIVVRLEGEYSGWLGKYLVASPFRTWKFANPLTVEGTSVTWDIRGHGTFTGALSDDQTVLSGTVQLVGSGGGASVPWEACRLRDDLAPIDLDISSFRALVVKHSRKCLGVVGGPTANDVQVQQYDYLGGNNQKWQLVPVEDGWYKIVAKHSGKCLGVVGGPAATANGVRIQQHDSLGGDNQKWQLVPVGDGWYKIVAKHSGKCLDVVSGPGAMANGVELQQYDYLGGDNQKWRPES